jgi:hypothetical protein
MYVYIIVLVYDFPAMQPWIFLCMYNLVLGESILCKKKLCWGCILERNWVKKNRRLLLLAIYRGVLSTDFLVGGLDRLPSWPCFKGSGRGMYWIKGLHHADNCARHECTLWPEGEGPRDWQLWWAGWSAHSVSSSPPLPANTIRSSSATASF